MGTIEIQAWPTATADPSTIRDGWPKATVGRYDRFSRQPDSSALRIEIAVESAARLDRDSVAERFEIVEPVGYGTGRITHLHNL